MLTQHFFDVHTHTQFAAFADDQDVVIQRALDAGVWMINVGTQRDTSAAAVETAHRYSEGVYATVGLHPIHTEKSYHDPQELGEAESPASSLFSYSNELENKRSKEEKEKKGGFTSRGEEFDYEYYKKLALDPKVVAIGECGLDYYREASDKKQEAREKQKKVFLQQIKLSGEVRKPLMIHCRNAFQDLISLLQTTTYQLQPSIVHFFSGTKDDTRKLLDLGFSFSFGGVITFARDYDEVIKYIPLERILLETDAPYVAPVPYRGKRNEPAYVVEVAKKIEELKVVDMGRVEEEITKNSRRLFKI